MRFARRELRPFWRPFLGLPEVLSGVDPLVAARYQIMVMAMLYGAAVAVSTLV